MEDKMKTRHTLLLLICFATGFSQDYYLHCGKILEVQSGKELMNQTIIVSKKKIIKIVDGFIPKAISISFAFALGIKPSTILIIFFFETIMV